MKSLNEVLQGKEKNYILPFYWQHGEPEELLREGLQKISESGIREACIEARPHPDWAGPGWWRDMDILFDEAKKLGMKLWILDDAHFPTGFLNGRIAEFPQARKQFAGRFSIDTIGPAEGASFVVKLDKEEELLAVVAAKRDREDPYRMTEVVDITENVHGNRVYWDVPEGMWCVTVIRTTYNGRDRGTHCNLIDRATVRLLLDICYEPHWDHYKDEFGKTLLGFFSDEPQMGNAGGSSGIAQVGNPDMLLSWCAEAEEKLRARWGADLGRKLLACWFDVPGVSPGARYDYMDVITDLFRVNFSEQVGDWCRAHGVQYIGHIIEDSGSHARLGHGPGHFFRSMAGQDMAGIDVVLQQIRPGLEDTRFFRIGGQQLYDGKFFHNLLAKMGSSLAAIDPKKHGMAMCEIYGAYGWVEGLKLMKWLTDHMLVRGINTYVPHAFTMKDFPDPDCPPHFYARGNNPQFPYFRYLMQYMNRVSHLINGGKAVPEAGLLYSAEGEWMDREGSQPLEEAALVLNRAQIDYRVLPEDYLITCACENGRIRVSDDEALKALVVSRRSYIRQPLADWIHKAAAAGIPILYLEDIPEILSADGLVPTGSTPEGEVIQTRNLVQSLREAGCGEVMTDTPQPYLRSYHYIRDDGEIFLFFNEDPVHAIDTWVRTPFGCEVTWYDAFDNKMLCAEAEAGRVHVALAPYEARILVNSVIEGAEAPMAAGGKLIPAVGPWKRTMIRAGENVPCDEKMAELCDISAPEAFPDFSGTIDYVKEIELEEQPQRVCIDLGRVYETAEVLINGQTAGVRIAPPYRLIADGSLFHAGTNEIAVRVVNTLAQQEELRDPFGTSIPLEPTGLLGPVTILAENKPC